MGVLAHKAATALPLPTIESVSQIAIFLGAFGTFAISDGNAWGYVVGLLLQPCYYYTTCRNRQWGMIAANFVYTGAFAQGIYKNFDKLL